MKNIDVDTVFVNGQWWIPGESSNKYPGTLEGCSAKGYRLKLESVPLDVEFEKCDILFGEADGECFSLHQCLVPHPSVTLPFRGVGHKSYNIYAVQICVGEMHVTQNAVFSALEFDIFGLCTWLVGLEGEQEFLRKYQINGYFLANNRVLMKGEFSLSTNNKWNHTIRKISAFFTFAFQKQTFPHSIVLHTTEGKIVRYYTRQSIPETPEEPVHARITLLPYFTVKDRLRRVFGRWFEMTDSMATWLYVSSIYKIGFAEHRFLSLTISLEGLYNHSSKQAKRDYNYRKKRVEILSSCPRIHRAWLRQKLKYAYEPTLKNKLIQLFVNMPQIISWLNLDKVNFEILLGFIAKLRNAAAHGNYKTSQIFTSGYGNQLTDLLGILCMAAYLKELNVPPKKIPEALDGAWIRKPNLSDSFGNLTVRCPI